MRNKKFGEFEEDDEEEGANWQDSYSDLMTDLLAIFVVLFSFAMMTQAIAAYGSSTKSKLDPGSIVSIIQSDQSNQGGILTSEEGVLPEESAVEPEENSSDNLAESINSYVDENELSEDFTVTKQGNNTILVRVSSSVLFAPGSADIHAEAEEVLNKMAFILTDYADMIKMIRIEGHTDDRPMENHLFDSNWELSINRAVNVLRLLTEKSKIEPVKFSAVGYGEFHPITDNDPEKGRTLNRRVDFVIETVSE